MANDKLKSVIDPSSFPPRNGTIKGEERSPNVVSEPETTGKTVRKRDSRDDLIDGLKADLQKIQKAVTCVICQDLMFEPYILQCGHVFCYTCIVDWLGPHKKNCPECRRPVNKVPAPAYAIRSMIETFVSRAELVSPHGNGAELRKQQEEALRIIEKDRATTGDNGGLWRGIFKKPHVGHAVRDEEDGVLRCPLCNWEVYGGYCEGCGARVNRNGVARDFSDGDVSSSDADDDEDEDYDEDDDEDHAFAPWLDFREDDLVDDDDLEEHLQDIAEIYDDDIMEEYNNVQAATRRIRRAANSRSQPIVLDEDDDDEEDTDVAETTGPTIRFMGVGTGAGRPTNPYVQRQMRRRRIGSGGEEETDDEEEEEEDEDTDLDGFVVHDTPERRGSGRPGGGTGRTNGRVTATSATLSGPSPGRAVVISDDDGETHSSVSEVSSRDPPFLGEDHRQYGPPIGIDSESDAFDESRLLSSRTGYTPLDNTASENDEDLSSSPPRGPRRRAVYSVPEEDEFMGFGDDDDSEDNDGDVRMGGEQPRNALRGPLGSRANPANSARRNARLRSPHQPVTITDDSDSDIVPARRRRRLQPATRTSLQSSGSSTAGRGRGTANSRAQTRANRLSREINPNFRNLFQQHSQRISEVAEQQFDSLGGRLSVSPARSLTPVQRNVTGNAGGNGNVGGQGDGENGEGDEGREWTPMAWPQSTPEFDVRNSEESPAPMASQSPRYMSTEPQSPSLSPAPQQRQQQQAPQSSPQPHQQSPAPQSPRLATRRATSNATTANNTTQRVWVTLSPSPEPPQAQQPPRTGPITIGSSPAPGPRVRARSSRAGLRGISSRSGLRSGLTSSSAYARPGHVNPPIIEPLVPTTSSRSPNPTITAAATRPRRGANQGQAPLFTIEDIRARGVERRAQMMGGSARSSRGAFGEGRGGRRLGAVIGGRTGGPMLVVGDEEAAE